ncbi:rod shape-determining protein RodA [Bacteroidales bacterium OttesenSCG-928-A17]|nr:rod shape-determining protein RodA [Bacteroidales bacterium OttesenSCG-928-A17]
MSYRKISIWNKLDWFTVAIYLILVVAGWFSIYAASYEFDGRSMLDLSGRSGMQMVWMGTSLALAFVLLMIDSDWYDVFSYWIYILIVFLLILTICFATEIKGSRSWLEIGPVRLQAAEFAKFGTALAVAKLMSGYDYSIKKIHDFGRVLLLIFLPVGLIFLQKETGSALVFLAFFLVLYREGMNGMILFIGFCAVLFFVLAVRFGDDLWGVTPMGEFLVLTIVIVILNLMLYNYKKGRGNLKYFLLISACGLIGSCLFSFFVFPLNLAIVALAIIGFLAVFLLFLYARYQTQKYLVIFFFAIGSVLYLYSVDYVFDEVLRPHQRIRIEVSLGMVDDPRGAGYNVNQSKIAIGSGGFSGKGFLNGTQTKLKYVPEQDTDFIFCTIGEEEGFVGTSLVLLLFLFLIIRLVALAERQRSHFSRIYGYCVASIIFFHVAINVGMVIGITPVIGIPLPFFSYGGSSLWAFTILLFIFLRLDASRADRL